MRTILLLLCLFTTLELFSQQRSFPLYKIKVDSLATAIDSNISRLSVSKMTGKNRQHEFDAKVYYNNPTLDIYKIVFVLHQISQAGKEKTFYYYKGNPVKLRVDAQSYYLFERKVVSEESVVINSNGIKEVFQLEEEDRKLILQLMR